MIIKPYGLEWLSKIVGLESCISYNRFIIKPLLNPS